MSVLVSKQYIFNKTSILQNVWYPKYINSQKDNCADKTSQKYSKTPQPLLLLGFVDPLIVAEEDLALV